MKNIFKILALALIVTFAGLNPALANQPIIIDEIEGAALTAEQQQAMVDALNKDKPGWFVNWNTDFVESGKVTTYSDGSVVFTERGLIWDANHTLSSVNASQFVRGGSSAPDAPAPGAPATGAPAPGGSVTAQVNQARFSKHEAGSAQVFSRRLVPVQNQQNGSVGSMQSGDKALIGGTISNANTLLAQ